MDEIPKLENNKIDCAEVLKHLHKLMNSEMFDDVAQVELGFGPYEVKEGKYAKFSMKLSRCEAGVDE